MLFTYSSQEAIFNTPLSICLLGISHHQEPINRPNGLPFFQWFYCESGRGTVIIEGHKSILNPGEGILIYPGVNHSYHSTDGPWIVSFIGFSGANCVEILRTLRMQESGIYHFNHVNPFLKFQLEILKNQELSKADMQHRLSVTCYDFLLTLSENIRFIDNSVETTDNETVQLILTYIEEHYSKKITIDDISKYVHLSKNYMQNIFKQEMHTTIMQHLNNVRVNNARSQLIRYPERPIYKIATDCGFEDASYFGYIFKKQTGSTPANFRRNPYTAINTRKL